jgi:L-alanine-DL-glutamate epimerase-like enolase superfamily enzyme
MELEKLVETWAKKAGLPVSEAFGPMVGACPVSDVLTAICRLAMAHAAEEAAKVVQEYPHWLGQQAKTDVIAAIRERFKA